MGNDGICSAERAPEHPPSGSCAGLTLANASRGLLGRGSAVCQSLPSGDRLQVCSQSVTHCAGRAAGDFKFAATEPAACGPPGRRPSAGPDDVKFQVSAVLNRGRFQVCVQLAAGFKFAASRSHAGRKPVSGPPPVSHRRAGPGLFTFAAAAASQARADWELVLSFPLNHWATGTDGSLRP